MKHLLLCAVFIATPLMAEEFTLELTTKSIITPYYHYPGPITFTDPMPLPMPQITPGYYDGDELMKRLDRIEKRLDELEKRAEGFLYISPPGIGGVDVSAGTGPYTCGRCGKKFKNRNIVSTCAVKHGIGQCCHYGEEEGNP